MNKFNWNKAKPFIRFFNPATAAWVSEWRPYSSEQVSGVLEDGYKNLPHSFMDYGPYHMLHSYVVPWCGQALGMSVAFKEVENG